MVARCHPSLGSYGFTYTGSDIVVATSTAAATALIGSTYVGGSGNDGLNQTVPLLRNYGDPFRGEIIMDGQDRPLVATTTTSSDWSLHRGCTPIHAWWTIGRLHLPYGPHIEHHALGHLLRRQRK